MCASQRLSWARTGPPLALREWYRARSGGCFRCTVPQVSGVGQPLPPARSGAASRLSMAGAVVRSQREAIGGTTLGAGTGFGREPTSIGPGGRGLQGAPLSDRQAPWPTAAHPRCRLRDRADESDSRRRGVGDLRQAVPVTAAIHEQFGNLTSVGGSHRVPARREEARHDEGKSPGPALWINVRQGVVTTQMKRGPSPCRLRRRLLRRARWTCC